MNLWHKKTRKFMQILNCELAMSSDKREIFDYRISFPPSMNYFFTQKLFMRSSSLI